MKNNSLSQYLYQIMLVVMICWGAHAWFTWEWDYLGLGRFYFLYAFIAITLFYVLSNNIKLSFKPKELVILFLWCIASLPPEFKIVSPFFEGMRFFPLLVLFRDRNNLESHLKFISVSIAIILIPGMILWTLIQTGYFSLPGIPIQMGESGHDNYYFYNYFVLLDRIMVESTRFQSIFLEPGYLGTMIALLLYANKYQWTQWYNWVLLLGLILSQSLAGYATFILGYCFYLFLIKKLKKSSFIALVFIGLFVYGMQYYNDGDNYINHNIIERLSDENNDKYVFSGNIRVKNETERIFQEKASTGNIFIGDASDLEVSGAGYKIFLIKYGLFAAFFYFITYYLLSRLTRDRRYGFYFLVLVVLTFLQAAYPFSYSWVIPFMLGVLLDNYSGKNIRYQLKR